MGLGTPSFSNGAAYADLDGDGDLDLIVNNVNLEAFVYRNMASETLHNHYLKIKPEGDSPNTFGFGASVTVYSKGRQQLLVQMPSRGFQSSVEPVLNFGLGTDAVADSLSVIWTNGRKQVLKNIKSRYPAYPSPVQRRPTGNSFGYRAPTMVSKCSRFCH